MSQGQKQYPDPEVTPKAKRRRFSAEYKLRILAEADGCTQPGEIGALLRREGLYSSHLTTWRRQRDEGQLYGLTGKKRGRKADQQAAELAQLRQVGLGCAPPPPMWVPGRWSSDRPQRVCGLSRSRISGCCVSDESRSADSGRMDIRLE